MNASPNWMIVRHSSRARWAVPLVFGLVAVAIVAFALLANVNHEVDLNRLREIAHRKAGSQSQQPAPTSPLAPLNIVKPLTPEQAIAANQERPFDAAPDTPARQFSLKTDANTRDRALECLTQAIYYEAASESTDGQRAVAQVILNRMRHPGFPPTVCGVVYQGSELPTGCQFTFTCDGSLARQPVASIWARARKVAVDALAGHVFAPVGHATHYHADYVLPYWADSLAKQVQIGHHIFYRLRGGLGTDAAFSQHYAGKEPDLPAPPSTVAVATQATDQAQALLNSGLAGDKPPVVAADAAGTAAASAPKQVLLADSSRGTLLIDKGAAPTTPSKRRAQAECAVEGSKQILPAAPTNLHAGSSGSSC